MLCSQHSLCGPGKICYSRELITWCKLQISFLTANKETMHSQEAQEARHEKSFWARLHRVERVGWGCKECVAHSVKAPCVSQCYAKEFMHGKTSQVPSCIFSPPLLPKLILQSLKRQSGHCLELSHTPTPSPTGKAGRTPGSAIVPRTHL
jgi:hypothetical protein